jgi:putative membrane protein insertion efficiency factor
MNFVQHALMLLIRLYRAVVSPLLVAVLGPSARCRFTPSCSQYALEAVRMHGALIGGWLALRRLGRCHPWGDCGEDPPPVAPSRLRWPRWRAPLTFWTTSDDSLSATHLWRRGAGRGGSTNGTPLPNPFPAVRGEGKLSDALRVMYKKVRFVPWWKYRKLGIRHGS